ncbi:MAG: hypothetical protein ABSH03_11035 [Candidatus Lustribacter sp.]
MASARRPVLDHLVTLTDDVAVFQHARFDIPNRGFGYCTDDVARALIVAVEATRDRATEQIGAKLVTTYLAFLHDAQLPDGWFHNFMGYDRRWQDHRGTEDAFGRAMWGLGHCVARAPRDGWRLVARERLDAALPQVARLGHLRSRAYAALGLAAVAAAAPGDARITAALREAVAPISAAFRAVATPDWRWCEDALTYDNARLCEALIRAGTVLGDHVLLREGTAMLDFYAGIVVEDGMFVPIGNSGWYPRGGPRARFGQQPLEAAALVSAALAAHAVTGDERYRALAGIAGDWYFGRNSHGFLMVTNGGCRDGIDATGVSPNMGAESTLAYLMSAIALSEARPLALRLAR